ncbi:hypothetical protein [Clostridium cadaveris]|uniref:hypothetical protein n=1 Tax=Clostridium cadaveris TaxID=1529 RepID=UPI001E45C520|nr:hypothetical protein [Clostridium cadaveris]UFH65060.1 hypothetical protein KQH81_00340 [Clostridium cadaveris]
MIKITVKYRNHEEKERLINKLSKECKVYKVSKEYGKPNALFKSVYVDLEP